MDRSRSPRVSDEARSLQRLAEPELPPGTTDAERATAAAEVEAAVGELGGEWAHAYQELHPDWQPSPTDIEISNQRAAELAAARVHIARLEASISVLRTEITRLEVGIAEAVNGNMFFHDNYGASIPLEALRSVMLPMSAQAEAAMVMGMHNRVQAAPSQPFSGEGHRLNE